ncbi:hypothetical protein [Candidatus Amarobacter glycogenicus]|uniref:hypothetical protein n=1 Tax=Candidatus Amarobacter glycogenicus TaxID=3140699 RepID=UPI002A0CD6D1|nr:hypothetical protein [Dehalococcoidia bacterium]
MHVRPKGKNSWAGVNWFDSSRDDYDPWPIESALSLAGPAWGWMADESRNAVALGQLLVRDTSALHDKVAAMAFRRALHVEVRLAFRRAGVRPEQLDESLDLDRLIQSAGGHAGLSGLSARAKEIRFDPACRDLATMISAVFAPDAPRGGLLSIAVTACRE